MKRWISYLISITLILPPSVFGATPTGLKPAEMEQISRELVIHYNTAVKSRAGMLALLGSAKKQDRDFFISWLNKNRIETLPEIQLTQDGSFSIPLEKKSVSLRALDFEKGIYELNGIRFQYHLQNSMQKNLPEIERVLKQTQSASLNGWTDWMIPPAQADLLVVLLIANIVAIVGIIGTDYLKSYLAKKRTTETIDATEALCRAKLKRIKSGQGPNFEISAISSQDQWKIKDLESDIHAVLLNYSVARSAEPGFDFVGEKNRDALMSTFKSTAQCTVDILDHYQQAVARSGKTINQGGRKLDVEKTLVDRNYLEPITIEASNVR